MLQNVTDCIPAEMPINLKAAVGRPSGCDSRGVRQGATRRNSGSIATSCNADRAPRGACTEGRSGVTQTVRLRDDSELLSASGLHVARSDQLPLLGSRRVVARDELEVRHARALNFHFFNGLRSMTRLGPARLGQKAQLTRASSGAGAQLSAPAARCARPRAAARSWSARRRPRRYG